MYRWYINYQLITYQLIIHQQEQIKSAIFQSIIKI